MKTPAEQRGPELLVRRNQSALRFEPKAWKDSRAWLASCIFHTLVLVLGALLWSPGTKGTNGEMDRPAGIALVHQTTNGTEYYLSGGASATSEASSSSVSMAAANAATPGATNLEELITNLLPSDVNSGNDTAASESTGAGLAGTGTSGVGGTGPGSGRSLNRTTAQFMGVSGVGSSFVYVLDRSDSMNTQAGAPFRIAKREVIQSIESLEENNQFQIVFYNDAPNPLAGLQGAKNRLLFAKESEVHRAKQFVRGMVANGGTEHIPALRLGLSYSSDVLFFMTDAEEPRVGEAELLDIQERAARGGTTIHTIQFHPGKLDGDGGWIRALAEMNRGTYRFVNTDEFQPE